MTLYSSLHSKWAREVWKRLWCALKGRSKEAKCKKQTCSTSDLLLIQIQSSFSDQSDGEGRGTGPQVLSAADHIHFREGWTSSRCFQVKPFFVLSFSFYKHVCAVLFSSAHLSVSYSYVSSSYKELYMNGLVMYSDNEMIDKTLFVLCLVWREPKRAIQLKGCWRIQISGKWTAGRRNWFVESITFLFFLGRHTGGNQSFKSLRASWSHRVTCLHEKTKH